MLCPPSIPRLRWPFPLALLFLIALFSAPVAGVDAEEGETTVSPETHRARLLQEMGAQRWHELGRRGRGIKVAILDSGFAGYRAQLGKTLPAQVTARTFRLDGDMEARDSQHGVLCAETVHALAPEAELLLANWEPNHPAQFLEALRWVIKEGASIVTCSIIMPTWSDGEGGGPVHPEIQRILQQGARRGGALFVACAGNTADRHWSGGFTPEQSWHTWAPGQIENKLLPWGGMLSVELCAASQLDLELSVLDRTTGKEVQRCPIRDGDYRCAVVRFQPLPTSEYSVRVRATGPKTGRFHLFVLGGGLEQARSEGSIAFPGDGREVLTVGAVDGRGVRQPYSSCGPNSTALKPDLVAMVPFASLFRTKPFAGTSAAAPQVAGLAALLWGRHPDWTCQQLRTALSQSAKDLGPRGHDWETGHGLVRLPVP